MKLLYPAYIRIKKKDYKLVINVATMNARAVVYVW